MKMAKEILGGVLGTLAGIVASYTLVLSGALCFGQGFWAVAWILALPVALFGSVSGCIAGSWLIGKYPKLFWVTIFPIAAYLICLMLLRHVDRPHQILRSFGYSEYFGGTNRFWNRLSPEEVQELLATGEVRPKYRLGPNDF